MERYKDYAVIWKGKNWLALRKESSYAVADIRTGAIFGANSVSHAIKKAQDNDKAVQS